MDYRSGTPRRMPGHVQQRHGKRLYDVSVDGQIWKRHANQLRPRIIKFRSITEPDTELAELPLLPCSTPTPSTTSATTTALQPTLAIDNSPCTTVMPQEKTEREYAVHRND
ncbi:hypothetical protein COOONC_02384 [Cooperia oncophora]